MLQLCCLEVHLRGFRLLLMALYLNYMLTHTLRYCLLVLSTKGRIFGYSNIRYALLSSMEPVIARILLLEANGRCTEYSISFTHGHRRGSTKDTCPLLFINLHVKYPEYRRSNIPLIEYSVNIRYALLSSMEPVIARTLLLEANGKGTEYSILFTHELT